MRTSLLLLFLALPALVAAQPVLYASGFRDVSGVTVDARGWLWVAEGGLGTPGTGRVSIVTPDGARHDFLTGLPSERIPFVAYSARSVHFLDGQAVVVMGGGTDPLAQTLLAVDTTGFRPGDPPRTPADATVLADIGAFAAGEGFPVSNPADLAVGPDGAWYVTDQSAQAVFRHDGAGELSVIATFPAIPNPAPAPPVVQAQPMGITAYDDHFLVVCHTSFPYVSGLASLREVWPDGTVSVLHDGLDNTGDVALDPRTGAPAVSSMGQFDPIAGSFLPGTGAVLAFKGGSPTPLADGFHGVIAMTYAPDGAVFFAEFYSGNVYHAPPSPVANEPQAPSVGLVLHAAAPNPFAAATTLTFDLAAPAAVRLSVYDVLGREVGRLVDGPLGAGTHTAVFDGRGLSSGVYVWRLAAGRSVQTGRLTLLE